VTLPSFRIPLRFLRANVGRTVATVAAVALGVALVCALDLVTRSMQRAFEEVIDTMAGRTSLEVSAGDGGLVREALAEEIARVPGVELAVPVVHATAFPSEGESEALTVQGVDVLNENALRVYEARDADGQTIDDPVRFLADPRSIVLTRTFADRRGLHQGDAIELDTPRGRRRFTILRLLEPQGIARVYGGNLVVMDITAAEDVFTQRGLVSRIDVVVGRDASVERTRSAIEAVLAPGLRVTTPAQRKLDLQSVMRSFGTLLRAVGLVGLVIAYLIAFNGVSSGFERRAWQLGVLAALGARSRAIWREQMKEALLLGVASVVLGIGLGIALAHVLLPLVAAATALNFNLIAPQARLIPNVASLVVAAVLGVGATLLAAWLPATRAVRLGIAMSVRTKGRETTPVGRTSWRLPLAFAAAAVGAMVLQSVVESAAFGLAATALVAAAIATAAAPLIQLVARLALPLLVRVAGASGRLAATGLRDHPRRVGLTTAIIAVGVAAVAWLGILARSFEGSVVSALGRAIRADVVVTSTNIGSGFLEAPLAADVVDAVRAVPGVQAAAGWRALEWPFRGEPIGLSAYDPIYFRDARFGEWPLSSAESRDAWERVAAGQGVVVSTSFVKSFGMAAGDDLTLDTPTGPLTVPIVGVTVDFVAPKGTVEMSRDLFAARWRDTSVTRTFVLKAPTVDGAELRRRIAADLGGRFRLRVLSAGDLLDYFVAQVRRAFAVIPVFAGIVYLVILAGLASSLATSVLERRHELAVVRAIGLRPGRTRRVVVLESLVIGCIGLALAAGGGLVLATMWVRWTFQLLLGWALTVSVPGPELVGLAIVTLVVCYAASQLPARRAGALSITDALRYE
jgi:putative ABC transport system permease protein